MTDSLLPADDEAHEVETDLTHLTGIRNKYTLATTPEQGSETDMLMINNFLTTLADVAISITSRNFRDKQEGEE